MSNIVDLFNEFKSDVEKSQFLAKQHSTITALVEQNNQLKDEVAHLKKLLIDSTNLLVTHKVERVILSPEEALIEHQIDLIQSRSLDRELTLEDVKKLDLLIKNKRLSKEEHSTIHAESKKLDKKNYSNAELLQIINTKKGSSDEQL